MATDLVYCGDQLSHISISPRERFDVVVERLSDCEELAPRRDSEQVKITSQD